MRRTVLLLATLVVALVLALMASATAAPDSQATRLRQPAYRFTPAGDATRPAYGGLVTVNGAVAMQAEPPADAPTRDNFATTNYLHFGNPAAGIAVIDTWTRVTYDDGGLPTSNQAGCRGIRARNVARLALRCILHVRGGTDPADATSTTLNSADAGNPVVFRIASPAIPAGYNPGTNTTQFCRSWSEVRYAIRWTDGTLSSGKTLSPGATLFNTRCFFLGGP